MRSPERCSRTPGARTTPWRYNGRHPGAIEVSISASRQWRDSLHRDPLGVASASALSADLDPHRVRIDAIKIKLNTELMKSVGGLDACLSEMDFGPIRGERLFPLDDLLCQSTLRGRAFEIALRKRQIIFLGVFAHAARR
jgi:hypothetical protein